MRTRSVVSIALLLLPVVGGAQRVPKPRTGYDPARPAPLPERMPEPIARELAYRRLRLSVESYPLISHVESPGFAAFGQRSSWTTFGAGTRADYRLTRLASLTLDLTSSLDASPVRVQTAEFGTRLRPEHSESRLYPYLDLRVGYVSAFNAGDGGLVFPSAGVPFSSGYWTRYSRGFGGVAGVGMEYEVFRSWSLTSGASVVESRMTSSDLFAPGGTPQSFAMTTYRVTLGLKYTPVRVIMP